MAAFAARADTPLGTLGSVLSLGGIWSRGATPDGRGSWVPALLALALAALAVWGYARTTTWPRAVHAGLAGVAVAGLLVAALPVLVGVDRLVALADAVPAAAVLRDGTRLLGPFALLLAVGLGAAVQRLADGPARAVGMVLALAPVALTPTLAWGLAGALRTSHYPAEWAELRRDLAAAPGDSAVLSLPWSSLRAYDWNGRVPVIDPAPRLLDRPVLAADDVRVGPLVVAGEDARAHRVGALLAASGGDPAGDLAGELAREGIGVVLVQRDQPHAAEAERQARTLGPVLHEGNDLLLVRILGNTSSGRESGHLWAARTGNGVGLVTLCILLVQTLVHFCDLRYSPVTIFRRSRHDPRITVDPGRRHRRWRLGGDRGRGHGERPG
jgi:hypothetical protein